MGASAWKYYVPYQPDTNQALQALRGEVFRRGEYFNPYPGARPDSIEQLLERNAESGTHSILDVTAARSRPAFGVAASLSPAELIQYFGTDRPTHDLLENSAAALQQIQARRGRGTGTYVVVYAGDQPAELLFFGLSGD